MRFACVVAALILSSCTLQSESTSFVNPQTYESADQLIRDLKDDNGDWECRETNTQPGYIDHPDEIDAAFCDLGVDNATVHIWDTDKNVPTIRKTDDPPHVWWVTGPNWFVATQSEQLAGDIRRAIGGGITSDLP